MIERVSGLLIEERELERGYGVLMTARYPETEAEVASTEVQIHGPLAIMHSIEGQFPEALEAIHPFTKHLIGDRSSDHSCLAITAYIKEDNPELMKAYERLGYVVSGDGRLTLIKGYQSPHQ